LAALSDLPQHRPQLVKAVARHLGGTHGATAAAVLGSLDDPDARLLIGRELNSPSPERKSHAIFGAALQRDATAMEVVRQASLDRNFQTPSRRQWLAVYFLTVDVKTVPDGLAILDDVPAYTRGVISRWATQTLCIRSGRKPPQEGLEAHRRELARQFNQRKLEWNSGPYIICTDIE
jgi:hypothetical protein